MATVAANKKKKPSASAKVSKVAKAVEKKVKSKRTNIAGIVSAIAAPVALLAIGYGLTRLDSRMGGKVMGMLFNK